MNKISYIKDKSKKLLSIFRKSMNNKRIRLTFIISITLVIVSILCFYFISSNEGYYSKTIAKIISVTDKVQSEAENISGNVEEIKNQHIKAKIMNGIYKGKEINLENTTSFSQAYDLNLNVNDEVFVTINVDANKKIISSKILDFKRDKYIFYIIILFVLFILLIGGIKGFRSLASVVINILIFSVIIELFLSGYNLILVATIASILFIIVSISLVSGINKKTVSAIIGTMVGTLISMLITAIVFQVTHSHGVHYEAMEFLTHPPEQIFFIEILIGTLGAIMDIAITISSAIKEIYERNNDIERKILIKSGMEIGKDIMGTMANTLVFAYISGSIPLILLWLKNDFPISYIVNINISLEIIRALTGSIGIVISIPATLYISVIILKNNEVKRCTPPR
jgi:uncharacterized membrane protein